jgi:hypothetical protein
MPKAYIEPRPKERPVGRAIEDFFGVGMHLPKSTDTLSATSTTERNMSFEPANNLLCEC